MSKRHSVRVPRRNLDRHRGPGVGFAGFSAPRGAGEETGSFSGARHGSQRRREAVDRDDEDVGLDALEPAITRDAQDRQRSLTAPPTLARAQTGRDVAHAGEVLSIGELRRGLCRFGLADSVRRPRHAGRW